MRYLIASDIHGSLESVQKLISVYLDQKLDGIFLLGDILYHGPRNPLPGSYDPKDVYELLNQYCDHIISVRGNCDSEVDEYVLSFPLSEQLDVTINGVNCHLEHGHRLDISSPRYQKYDIVFYGHTHVHEIFQIKNTIFVNPGSPTLPKGDGIPSYVILEEHKITLHQLDNHKVIGEIKIK